MNKLKLYTTRCGWVLLFATIMVTACKKDDHFIGGSATSPKTDLTTYDYLKQNKLFDTLIMLIDKAGMKDEINGDVTFFASTNYSIKLLLDARSSQLQLAHNNENLTYTIDSFPPAELRDSIRAYMFKGKIVREDLSLDPTFYKNLDGQDFVVRLRETTDYGGIFDKPVRYMSLTKIINGKDPEPLPPGFPKADIDKEDICRTTGILTKTGVLHVLNNNHFFYWR
ncbi:hypothetical protein CLV51_103440 [Chitinophaga niastensis]|uniref:Fasciclin domain-containing protein n=1 Tax=Chitinophaga niastensis TaxID=536980 RepID=A0A2P8HJR7_CHINA|nr:hypothetical protein [Chitinophaga niastensis]PSL46461.1 hypothetical protein CLV51_103440 [Chitinophaga niastensis]